MGMVERIFVAALGVVLLGMGLVGSPGLRAWAHCPGLPGRTGCNRLCQMV